MKEKQSRVGENNPMFGRHHSQSSKDKMREAHLKFQAKVRGTFTENNAIGFIIKKGLYDEYTKWVYEIVSNEFKTE